MVKKISIWILAMGVFLPFISGAVKADSISPASFSATLDVGKSTTITKTITVDAGVQPLRRLMCYSWPIPRAAWVDRLQV